MAEASGGRNSHRDSGGPARVIRRESGFLRRVGRAAVLLDGCARTAGSFSGSRLARPSRMRWPHSPRSALRGLSTFEEKSTDWVAESAALRKAVLVERYLFDPHDGDLATAPPPGVRRLFLPAVRAFGTGSHESTRLAVRLLLSEDLRGARVLDVGCGTGTLAFVAALEGRAPGRGFRRRPARRLRDARAGARERDSTRRPRSPVPSRRSATRPGSTSSSRT